MRVSAIATAALAITAWLAFAVLVGTSQKVEAPSPMAYEAPEDRPLFERRNIEEASKYGMTAVQFGDDIWYFTEEEVRGA